MDNVVDFAAGLTTAIGIQEDHENRQPVHVGTMGEKSTDHCRRINIKTTRYGLGSTYRREQFSTERVSRNGRSDRNTQVGTQ